MQELALLFFPLYLSAVEALPGVGGTLADGSGWVGAAPGHVKDIAR